MYHLVQGEDITLPCSASGSPKPTVMWEHEVFNQQPVPLYQQGPSELLHLNNLTANSSGTYSCKIWSSRGRRILRKTVIYVAEKPEANIRSFSDGPFKEGGPLELYCQAEGFPAPEVGHKCIPIIRIGGKIRLISPGLLGVQRCEATPSLVRQI